ncbi:hypothetical protein IAT40_006755 [Kwoniella sp. CBS 6097]
MAPPPVSIYVTSLTSQPKVRQHIDLLRRSLRGLEIPYEEHDLVIDEDAKKRWQRSKPPGVVVGLPGYLVGGEWVGTMDDFEDAVETQRLPEFLKQDLDLSTTSSQPAPASSSSTGSTNIPTTGGSGAGAAGGGAGGRGGGGGATKTVQEVELEKLMREMSDADLDKLMGELGVEEGSAGAVNNKIGLLHSNNNKEQRDGISDVKETEKGLIAELKEEARLDDEEDIVLRKATPQPQPTASEAEAEAATEQPSSAADTTGSETATKNTSNTNAIVGEKGLGSGEGLKGFSRDEGDLLSELKDELRADKNEDKDIGEAVGKEKVD